MIIKVYYAGGRIDVFDTDRMTDGVPQPGNLLTNYTLDLSDVNGESLWLCSYYYEAAEAYKDESGPKGLPVARRRDGWRIRAHPGRGRARGCRCSFVGIRRCRRYRSQGKCLFRFLD